MARTNKHDIITEDGIETIKKLLFAFVFLQKSDSNDLIEKWSSWKTEACDKYTNDIEHRWKTELH